MGQDQLIKTSILLGFDLGSKSLGIALKNRLGMIMPLPAWFFPRLDEPQLWSKLSVLIQDHHPKALVFGVPYQDDGRESPQTAWVKGVIARLIPHVQLPIITVNERFTTLEAKDRLHQFGLPEKKQKEYIDSVAACIMLEQYERQPR